ncbi:30S ribosomal protein S20 [Patescibacteria group bacterium]|nr:30S ribosomal protein S20 [Patescibacteria group bacterium]
MPNTKSAKKALRQSERKRVRNLRGKRDLLSIIKNYKKSVEAGDTESASSQLPKVYKSLDKAAKTNLIKKNKAGRLKSRLTKRLGKSAPTEHAPKEAVPEITDDPTNQED